MNVIIAGSRDFTDYNLLCWIVDKIRLELNITRIICGMAPGTDMLGDRYGKEHNIPVDPYPAKWRVNGKLDKSAGYKRNVEMAKNAQAVILFWDFKSPGTNHMLDISKKYGLKGYLIKVYIEDKK